MGNGLRKSESAAVVRYCKVLRGGKGILRRGKNASRSCLHSGGGRSSLGYWDLLIDRYRGTLCGRRAFGIAFGLR